MDNLEASIRRARALLSNPGTSENYVSLKIKPTNAGCCCFHCWPQTWREVNSAISRYGRLEDEGDVLIRDEDTELVLECHESGPELVTYLPIGISGSILLVNIISLIVKSRQRESMGARFNITRRVIRKTEIIEEEVMEVDCPMSKENVRLLNQKLRDILKGLS